MRITDITLHNFRNYRELSVALGAQTTVFIGRNGMGKSNLMGALHRAIRFVFARIKETPQEKFLSSSDQKVTSFAVTDARYGNENGRYDYCYPVSIKAHAMMVNGESLSWDFYQYSSVSGLDQSLYHLASNRFWETYLYSQEGLPVFAFFSDSYPHIKAHIGKKTQAMLDSGNALPRNMGYYKWDDERNCAEVWNQYFVMQKKNAIYGSDKGKMEYVAAVERKMMEFADDIDEYTPNNIRLKSIDIEARGKGDVMVYVFADGGRCPADQLPQGYRRLFSMAFDLANRSYMLNKHCDSTGLCIIDEIELHLHPSLAQEVLTRFKRAFPKMQFVVTTHSPLVLTRLSVNRENLLYSLSKDKEDVVFELISEDLYGVDANRILKGSMEAEVRSSDVQRLMDCIQDYINNKQIDEARKVLKDLERMTSENHQAVVRMSALLHRMEVIGK